MSDEPRMHEVRVLCFCSDVERCRMEMYVSDVRIAYAEIERLRQQRTVAQAQRVED